MPLPKIIPKNKVGYYMEELKVDKRTGEPRSLKQRLAIILSKRSRKGKNADKK